MKIKYTMIEDWMSTLEIRGATMIIFAVIFGFAKSFKTPVELTYADFERFTGCGRSCIAEALSCLRNRGLISTCCKPGYNGCYDVIIHNLPSEARDSLSCVSKRCLERGRSNDLTGSRPESGLHQAERSMGPVQNPDNK